MNFKLPLREVESSDAMELELDVSVEVGPRL